MMGCSTGDGDCLDDEKPAHEVAITKGFWLGQTEVTQEAYRRVTGTNPSHFQGLKRPVEGLNWREAEAFCQAVGTRLPSEAEWEYAARAGSTGSRPGDLDQVAWYSANSGGQTHDVGQKQPNAWGLYDMLGNVWEWTADWYAGYTVGSQSHPRGPGAASQPVLRGGSWPNDPWLVRASYRASGGPEAPLNNIGLRCAGNETLEKPLSGSKTGAPASRELPPTSVAAAIAAAILPWQRPASRELPPTSVAPAPAPEKPIERPAAPPEIATGARKVNPGDGLTYVWIPPGTFMMGCSPGDNECDSDEKPEHEVTITKGFWLGQTEVTQEAYQRAQGTNPSHFQGLKRPVDSLNWYRAEAFCQAVGMRLPSEAEWEYAARAGSTGIRYGDLDEVAWYSGNSGGQTHEVGQKQPNAWGLYDMLGNVWEWTEDRYSAYKGGSQSDPHGPGTSTLRTQWGGSIYSDPRHVRASFRAKYEPRFQASVFGLRCAGN
jgi:formylglycine-generating enzyme required for sulfatase activity